MELKVYLRPVLKWWWLLALATLLAVSASYIVARRQPPVYQSRTTLVAGSAIFASNPNSGELFLNQQLASFYAELASRDPVRNATREALELSFLPPYTARPLPNSQFIEIVVTDTDPLRAQVVARELADQLIKQTPANDDDNQERQAFIERQLQTLEARITEIQTELIAKQNELATLTSAREISETENEIATLERNLSDYRSDYSSLLDNSTRGAVNTLSILEAANPPRQPVGPSSITMVILSAAVAFSIAAAAAYILEYLDDTLKLPEDITRLIDLPIIGYISDVEKEEYLGAYVTKHPRSAVAEAFRALRTDLEYSSVDKPIETILITSPDMAAGKTSIAINLAVVLAQSGKRVVLIDGDLRKPSVHRSLGLSNHRGLADIFRGNLDIHHVVTNWKDGNLSVLTSGGQPPNPTELLGSKKMDQILADLKEQADVLVIDGPPFLVTDATILSTKVDGVVLVCRYGHTRRNVALNTVKQLHRVDARVLGVVLNRIPRAREELFGIYNYYYREYYAQEGEEIAAPLNGRSWLSRIIRRKSEPVLEHPKSKDTAE